MDFLFVYVTVPDTEAARHLGKVCVEEGLAACANILPAMMSVYKWQGRIEEASEAVLILKTAQSAYAALESRIKTLHPYDTPCIVAIPLVHAEEGFAQWLAAQIEPFKNKDL